MKTRMELSQRRALLEECVWRKAPCTVLDTASAVTFRGQFAFVTQEKVGVDVDFSAVPRTLRERTLAAVHFGSGRRSYAFMANVISVSDVGVNLAFPTEIASIQSRLAFRVPVSTNAEVAVTMAREGMSMDATTVDLSLAGVQLKLPRDVDLQIGERIPLVLRHAEESFPMQAEVRRVDRHATEARVGMWFPVCMRDGKLDPPPELAKMVGQLERRWLRGRPEAGA